MNNEVAAELINRLSKKLNRVLDKPRSETVTKEIQEAQGHLYKAFTALKNKA